MVRYLSGAKHAGPPVLRVQGCKSVEHAYKLISGNPAYKQSRDYISWSSSEDVRDRAAVFFENGDPFRQPLKRYELGLKVAITIRNRIAHSSRKASDKFKKAAKDWLKSKSLRQGYMVGDFLLEQPNALSQLPCSGESSSLFDSFVEMYGDLARSIVP
jgi:hypothetical protein